MRIRREERAVGWRGRPGLAGKQLQRQYVPLVSVENSEAKINPKLSTIPHRPCMVGIYFTDIKSKINLGATFPSEIGRLLQTSKFETY